MNTNVINIRLEKKRISCSRKPCKRIILERVSSGMSGALCAQSIARGSCFYSITRFRNGVGWKDDWTEYVYEGSDQIR